MGRAMIETVLFVALLVIACLGVANLAMISLAHDTLSAQTNATVLFFVSAFVVLAFVAGCANRAPQWDAYKLTVCEPALVITDKGVTYRDCGL
jgi:biotin transporter BioY